MLFAFINTLNTPKIFRIFRKLSDFLWARLIKNKISKICMFIQVIIALTLGICCGIVTGLIPGIHINLLAVLLLSSSPFLLKYTNPLVLCVFIISMSVIHTFLDSIPSIFLGAPDSATVLGVLPGHRYLLKGFGLMAVKLTIIGSFGALILSIILFPFLLPVVKFIYPYLAKIMGILLISVICFMIYRDKKKLWAITVFFLSGTFGIIVLNIPNFDNALFPMLSGLFGISTLLMSLQDKNNIPKQKQSTAINLKKGMIFRALSSGTLSGFITAVMPGLGGSTAAVISMQLPWSKDLGDHGFMILMGSINTVNFVLSMVTLYVLDKARNGSIIVVQELLPAVTGMSIVVFLCTTLVAGCCGVYLALFFGRLFSTWISKVNYQLVVWSVIGFITLLVIILTKWIGIIVLLTSTAIGFIPAITKVTRTHAMGCLLLPVVLFFIL